MTLWSGDLVHQGVFVLDSAVTRARIVQGTAATSLRSTSVAKRSKDL